MSGTAAGAVGGGALAYGALQSVLTPAAQHDASASAESNVRAGSTDTKQTADLIVECIRQRYPHEGLDAVALAVIRNHVTDQVRRSAVLSSFPLSGDDRPALLFAPVAGRTAGVE
ncbi:MAG: hypothetical protein O3A00_06800 [Planctomycetota bacterium]|nr:hypothetical protein [Planctomycetota bacterium]